MKLIGITGNIGSGKSTVCQLLKVLGYPVYIADTEAKRLTETPEITKEIKEKLGDSFFENGKMNRKKLAEIVFNDSEKLQTLNNIIHPAVHNDFCRWTERQQADFAFVESAILLQTKIAEKLDNIILVCSPEQTKIARASLRDNASPEDVAKRLGNQNDETQMRKKCGSIIVNDGKTAVIPQVIELLKTL